MKIKIFQKGFNYSQDGDGNRLVLHLQGCNMKCPWCANPEGMDPQGVLLVDREWLWDGVCPHGAVKKQRVDREKCRQCPDMACIYQHRCKGIRLSHGEYTTEELLDEILRSRPMFYDGGGVTFTGGEATLQFQPLKALLQQLHATGIHTAIETNGAHPRLTELLPFLDLLIIDFKHWEDSTHRKYTGLSNEPVRHNILAARDMGTAMHVRVPVIGGFNDSDRDFQEFIDFFTEVGRGKELITFEVLRYHEFGRIKWEQCGYAYQMTEQAHVEPERISRFQTMIIESGLHYKRT